MGAIMQLFGGTAGKTTAAAPARQDYDCFETVYLEMKRIARCHMRSELRSRTIQATALVHETFLKMARMSFVEASQEVDRQYLLCVASRMMRRILVDRARARMAQKRDPAPFYGFQAADSFMQLHDALGRLAAMDARQARIVEMRFFGGFTEEEVACALGVCSRTVKRDWQLAKAWLLGELSR
jgi:RNA polymerase sigma factor (TIGR02999 family)